MADNYGVLDGAGNPITKASKDLGGGIHSDKTILYDTAGVAVTYQAPGRLISSSSTSVVQASDYSISRFGTLTFTATAVSYTAGNIVGAAASCTLMGVVSKSVMITDATILIPDATAVASAWRLELFDVTPPSALANNTAFVLAAGDRTSYRGYLDLGTCVDKGSTQYAQATSLNKTFRLGATPTIFAYLTPLTTSTLVAAAIGVDLYGMEV